MSDDGGTGANVEELAAEWLDRVLTGAAALYGQQVLEGGVNYTSLN